MGVHLKGSQLAFMLIHLAGMPLAWAAGTGHAGRSGPGDRPAWYFFGAGHMRNQCEQVMLTKNTGGSTFGGSASMFTPEIDPGTHIDRAFR